MNKELSVIDRVIFDIINKKDFFTERTICDLINGNSIVMKFNRRLFNDDNIDKYISITENEKGDGVYTLNKVEFLKTKYFKNYLKNHIEELNTWLNENNELSFLKVGVIEHLSKYGNEKLLLSNKSYTANELINELQNNTAFSQEFIVNLINTTLELIKTNKI